MKSGEIDVKVKSLFSDFFKSRFLTLVQTFDFFHVSLSYIKQLLFFSPPDFLGQMSCLDTGGLTQVWSPTSVQCARRSLPAVTTCQNTLKSTVFHEQAGQFAQLTDDPLRSLGSLGKLRRPMGTRCGHDYSVWICERKDTLLCIVLLCSLCCSNLLDKCKWTFPLPPCNQQKVVVAVGAVVCCSPFVCSVLIPCLSRR